uniref:Uncharacterized protein n=1 Tax=Oryza sativa subsp. japonica TaxID=39947 RepID=Q6ERG7_ORYSJ|nr:hypothetical protein [Oryza sativa Japonica Group]
MGPYVSLFFPSPRSSPLFLSPRAATGEKKWAGRPVRRARPAGEELGAVGRLVGMWPTGQGRRGGGPTVATEEKGTLHTSRDSRCGRATSHFVSRPSPHYRRHHKPPPPNALSSCELTGDGD